MANSRIQLSSIKQGFPKSRSMLAGNTAYDPAATWLIQRITATGGETSITFSSIPQTYKHLQIRGITRDGADSALVATFNGDSSTANYAQHRLYGNGTSVTADGFASGTFGFAMVSLTNGVPASTYASFICDIHDYANTSKNKTVRSFYGQDRNGSGIVGMASSLWLSTAAISTILLKPYSGTFAAGSTFALYGMVG